MKQPLRTPDERFRNLPEYDFAPHYVEIPDEHFGSLRMHYLEEGPPDAPVVLLLHGQGSWVYLYRRMIPLLVASGFRVIAPDYIGFGRSDKLPSTGDYTFQQHIDWMTAFFDAMNFRDVTAYLFDWGGFFALRIAAGRPEFFGRLVLSNTMLPTGEGGGRDWFIKWREQQFALPRFPQGEMVSDGVANKLRPEIIAAFDAPYPDESYKTGPRRLPMILPIMPDDPAAIANGKAWEILAGWQKPVLTLFSAAFAGTAMGPERLIAHLPGARGQPHALLKEANFYITEDQPGELARHITAFAGPPQY
ncbi:MAG: haloalkane dehalogenase [Gammaproteobacteria bacterium]|nr:haloalkane dehalogenase [Gammaproteobacteria bacterium]